LVAHHRFSIQVACPGCGIEGAVKVVEDGGPPFTDTPRRVYSADPETFVLIAGSEPPGIKCRACRAIFVAPV
jgi:hypothetical protein